MLVPSLSFAWGFDGHRRLASLMQDAIPQNHCLRTWFSSRQTSTLQDHACDPDRWRGTDVDEWPRHFLEVDWSTPTTAYPREFPLVIQHFGDRVAKSNGTVPWRVEERYALLVAAFRAKDTSAILDNAFVLSHYVFDAFSILHDTKNSDPNNGLHARWESDMLNVTANINGITTLAATYYGTPGRADPRNNVFDVVIEGNKQVNALVAADTASTTIAQLYTATKDMTARRWGDGVTVMSSILWSAWADAGSPELPGFAMSCSRSVPVAEIVIKGFPTPGGFTHPVVVPDAGPMGGGAGGGTGTGGGTALEDGGVTGGGDPGTGGGSSGFGGGVVFGGGLGGGGGTAMEGGCQCESFDGAFALLGLSLLARRRRAVA